MPTSVDHALHYQLMFTENKAVMLLIDPNSGAIIDASIGACQYYGYSLSELTAMSIFDINTMSKAEIAAEMQRAKDGFKNHFNFRHRLASGEIRAVEVYSNPIPIEGQKFLYSVIHDITDRKRIEEILRKSEAKYHLAMEATQDGLWDWDITTDNVYYSPGWGRILGIKNIKNSCSTWEERINLEDKSRILDTLRSHLAGETTRWIEEHRLRNTDGSWIWVLGRGQVVERDRDGNPLRMVGTMTDITERKQIEERLEYLATHDSLTELYNRKVLEQRLNDELLRSARYNHALSAFVLDLDHFKSVNDTYGHQVGDAVLRSIARVLESSIRKTDYAARYGGEEFVIILPETPLTEAEELAERLLIQISEHSITIEDGKEINMSASIGVSTFPEHGDSADDLLNAADSAMYDAKDSGRNCVRVAKNV